MSRIRIVGTVEAAIEIEESILGRKLPPSFRHWLLENNSLRIGETHIYPVRDERDTRKTWNSLSHNMQHEWSESLGRFSPEDFTHLLPFADSDINDYYCFDYSLSQFNSEQPVVLWFGKTGKVEKYANNFSVFKDSVLNQCSRVR